jgi:hypothetical protein
MSAARQLVVNTWTTCRVTSDQLLTKPERWGGMDYREIEHTDVHAKLRCIVTQAGTGHGLAAGFDRTVSEGWYLSNAPDASEAIRPKRIYGIVFFPWERPVVLDPGDVVDVELSATLAGEDYVWSWKTRVLDAGRTDSVKARFEQSTFHGTPLSLAQLRKKAEGYAPTLNVEGQVVRFVLDAMQGSDSVGDIADGLLQQFPVRFTGRADAVSYVARLSKEFG